MAQPAKPAFYEVRNWQQFQHYKDRNPAWIKLHFALLQSEDWVTLADASKLLAVVCMLLASRNSGRVPNNPAYIKRVAFLDRLPNLKPLIDSGFLSEPLADASTVQADAPKRLSRGEERRGKKEEPKGSLSETDVPDARTKKVSRGGYPADFEAAWKAYPTDRLMSKKKAGAAWSRLTAEDRERTATAIPEFVAYCRSHPDYRPVHMVRFITEARADGFLEAEMVVTEDDWQKRLVFARGKKKSPASEWGPAPGQPNCRIPEHLLQLGDGVGWAEWKSRTQEPAK